MQTNKILAALIASPNSSAKELAQAAGISRNTVETVIQRNANAITATTGGGPRKPGRPEHRYTVKPEWIPVLQQRWTVREPETSLPVVRMMATLEAASLAALDEHESAEERSRFLHSTRTRIKATRTLLGQTDDEVIKRDVISRLERVERVISGAKALVPFEENESLLADGDVERTPPVPIEGSRFLQSKWQEWVSTLHDLASRYRSSVINVDYAQRGMALILDLIPGQQDPIQKHLLKSFEAQSMPVMCMQVADMSLKERITFFQDFESVALNPVARHAELYVTLDSQNSASKDIWQSINELGQSNRALRAVSVANASLRDVRTEIQSPQMLEYATDYYTDFIADVLSQAENEQSLWPVLGKPNVLDLGMNGKFRKAVELQSWNYRPRAANFDVEVGKVTKKTKISELRSMTGDQLHDKLLELKKEQFDLRFQKAIGDNEISERADQIHKSIAQIRELTVQKSGNRMA